MLKATVLIPTHNHGKTLLHAVQSVLSQTVQEIEIFVIGDGVPDETRNVMSTLMQKDARIRFLDNPKGPRHGEVCRHAVLAKAKGKIVAYLCDDDLWLPNHLEKMIDQLEDADFTHSLPFYIDRQGDIQFFLGDLALPFFQKRILSGQNWIPLSCAAHTMKLYRELPYGWRTTPSGIHTDMYMWQQIITHPNCRFKSGTLPTTIHFPTPLRLDNTLEERFLELSQWSEKITQPLWRENFIAQVLDTSVRERAQLEQILTERELSAEWRLGVRLMKIPGMKPLIKWVAKAVSSQPIP